jgi:hypothetical protein
MALVTITVTEIDQTHFPDFATFEIVDVHGVTHRFIQKVPVIGLSDEDAYARVFPFQTAIACSVIEVSLRGVLVDMSIPNLIEALSGQSKFLVPPSAMRKLDSQD